MPKFRFKDKRRSDRIAIALPIQVRGIDSSGTGFEEYTKTLEVGRHGTKFGLKTSLQPNQMVIIVNVRHDTEANFRVLGPALGPDPSDTFWGAEGLDPSAVFWGIDFPPIEEGQEATARILLQCGKCKNQELCYLSDLETEVFGLTDRIHRPLPHL